MRGCKVRQETQLRLDLPDSPSPAVMAGVAVAMLKAVLFQRGQIPVGYEVIQRDVARAAEHCNQVDEHDDLEDETETVRQRMRRRAKKVKERKMRDRYIKAATNFEAEFRRIQQHLQVQYSSQKQSNADCGLIKIRLICNLERNLRDDPSEKRGVLAGRHSGQSQRGLLLAAAQAHASLHPGRRRRQRVGQENQADRDAALQEDDHHLVRSQKVHHHQHLRGCGKEYVGRCLVRAPETVSRVGTAQEQEYSQLHSQIKSRRRRSVFSRPRFPSGPRLSCNTPEPMDLCDSLIMDGLCLAASPPADVRRRRSSSLMWETPCVVTSRQKARDSKDAIQMEVDGEVIGEEQMKTEDDSCQWFLLADKLRGFKNHLAGII